ncbi:MAG: hypothetical protein WC756_03890 [Taibaiella sp.]|jgi:hypothetical protein
MEAFKNKYHYSLFLAFTLLMFSCASKKVCPEDVNTMEGKIVSLSGVQNIRAGEQAAITVGVRNESSLCVKEALASFQNVGLDTLLVSAELSYIDSQNMNDCDCKRDSIVYTLLYFTPLNGGTYHFVTKGDSSVTNAHQSDRLDFVITAD